MKSGKTLRDEGIALVALNTDSSWAEEAFNVVETLANSRLFFTSDDVWDGVSSKPHNNSAMGAVFKRAQKAGVIKPTGGFHESRRAKAHSRMLRVWTLA